MNPEDIERRLSEAFADRAFRAVDDHTALPPLQLNRSAPRRHRVVRVLAPLTAAAAVAAVAVGIALHQDNVHGTPAANGGPQATHTSSISTPKTIGRNQVAVKIDMPRTATVGVGMPVVAYFSQKISDGRDLQKATIVTVEGKPVQAAWYFTESTAVPGYPMEAHLRTDAYWPAHAKITVAAAIGGLPAGGGLTFADGFNLTFDTGTAMIATVSDLKHTMTVTADGKFMGSFPVSLGSSLTPTMSGTKVIMAKGASICLTGPGYHECNIKYTQQLSTSGEYLIAAPWNVRNIDRGIDSSNGCTNLNTADAARLFSLMEVGDVVKYVDSKGAQMKMGEGIADWNIPWKVWLTGGLVPTH